jgi:hypothetical protein
VSVIAIFFSNPLIIAVVSLIVANGRFFKQALIVSFTGGIVYSLLSFSEGFMSLGILSLCLLFPTVLVVFLKSLLSGPKIADLLGGALLLIGLHLLLFRVVYSHTLVLSLVLYCLLFAVVPGVTRFIKKPGDLVLSP